MGRMEKVNQLIKREIGSILQGQMKDPRFTFVTITKADVSPDLHNARVNFSFLGNSSDVQAIEDTLNHASGYIRKLMGKKIKLRFTPHLEFIYDPSIEYSAQIDKTLKEISQEGCMDPNEVKEG